MAALNPYDDYVKWYRWACEQRYGKGSWNRRIGEEVGTGKSIEVFGFQEYQKPFKTYWNDELSVRILERNGKYTGVACLVAKEITDRENFIRKFGLSFEKDVQWKAASSLLTHLSKSPAFKAILITTNKIPFRLEPDIPEELRGRIEWAKRNYNFHKEKAGTLRLQIESQKAIPTEPYPAYLPKQMKGEQDHARKFLETVKVLESQAHEHFKNYFLIKENLFAATLFFYIYTNPNENLEQTISEILARKRAAKIEANETYFVRCNDVKDPIIVFNPEFFLNWDEVRKYYGIALAQDCAGFNCNKDVAEVLRKFFTTALELPKETEIEEQIHIPTEEVSIPRPKSAFLGWIMKSIIKNQVTKRRVYFPLNFLTDHGIVFGRTRIGKSHLALILIQEALANGVRVKVFDPHGTLVNRLRSNELLEVFFTRGKADITEELQKIYDEASASA